MSDVLNPSFEDPGPAHGQALYWTEGQGAAAEDIAWFATPERALPYEGFDAGWDGNELAVASLSEATVQPAMFSKGTEAQETFNSDWVEPGTITVPPRWNHQMKWSFSSTDLSAASFDTAVPEDFEDFEEEWDDNEDAVANWGGATSTAGLFDVAVPEPVEDFEEEWLSNETAVANWGGATSAHAMFDAGANSFENFEGVWTETFV